jgi:hypothetical protein
MVQILIISGLLVWAALLLFTARQYSRASKALDVYMDRFGKLTDDDRVPVLVLERLHTFFKDACHPCASIIITITLLRFAFSKDLHLQKREVSELKGLDAKVLKKIADTAAALYIYASYAIPGGFITRILVRHFSGQRHDGKRDELFVVKASTPFERGHWFPYRTAA